LDRIRTTSTGIWNGSFSNAIENNLSIADMDFEEFAESVLIKMVFSAAFLKADFCEHSHYEMAA